MKARILFELTCEGEGCKETVSTTVTQDMGDARMAVEFSVMLLENNWGRGYPDHQTYFCPVHNDQNWEELEDDFPAPTDGGIH